LISRPPWAMRRRAADWWRMRRHKRDHRGKIGAVGSSASSNRRASSGNSFEENRFRNPSSASRRPARRGTAQRSRGPRVLGVHRVAGTVGQPFLRPPLCS
jgi:hypothetical protein